MFKVRVPRDQKAPSISIDQGFAVNIPDRDLYLEPIESENDVNCYTEYDVNCLNEYVVELVKKIKEARSNKTDIS